MTYRTYPRLSCLLIASTVATNLAGCAVTGYPTDYQDTDAVIKADAPYLAANVRSIGTDPSDGARGGMTQQQYRDAVIYARKEVIDAYYYEFEADLTGTYNGFDAAADLSVLVLNGLGAVTGGTAAKAALAAASAGVIGSKGAINTDIFYQKTLPTLVTQMRAARQQTLLKIETGIAGPVSQYPIGQALDDISAYYIAGTLPSAVSQITASAGAAYNAASANIDSLRVSKFVTPSATSAKLIAWLFPSGDETKPPDKTKLTSLLNWMTKYSSDPRLAAIPYGLFLHQNDSTFESDRAQAIKDLKLP